MRKFYLTFGKSKTLSWKSGKERKTKTTSGKSVIWQTLSAKFEPMLSWSHYSSEEIEKDAEKVLRKYFDQDFSYTDAISFAIMKRYKMGKSFSFDKHFVTAGFVNIPP